MRTPLETRIITALVLVAGFLAAIFLLPPIGAVTVFAVIVALAAWEWAGLLHMRPGVRRLYALLTLILCGVIYAFGMPAVLLANLWFVSIVFWLLVVPLWLRRKWRLGPNAAGFLVGWLLLIPSWAGMVTLEREGPLVLLAAMAVVWVADIAAYFGGRAWGRHKLAPSISPGKTWEGALAALIAVEIYGLGLGTVSGLIKKPLDALYAALALGSLTLISILGDLFESMAKRQAGQKDSSALLPGHGGVLDRIDSLTSTLPFAALAAFIID